MSDISASYRGRFAPSPSGPLHLGSLIAALASYLDARHRGGTWLVRMDDLDPPREQAGAAKRILTSLQAHGLLWNEEVVWQGQRTREYEVALNQLVSESRTFRCYCTRQQLNSTGSCAANCQNQSPEPDRPHAIRISLTGEYELGFRDQIQGRQAAPQLQKSENFVIRRKDGFYAYQLAVVVDDAAQGIDHIVRGSDLLDSTWRQIYLQKILGLPTPTYCHHPVIVNADGQKLSKQNHAPALVDALPAHNLRNALAFLGQSRPPEAVKDAASIISHACENWSVEQVPRGMALAGIWI